jgi:glyoxylase-like metal-dependent hydrolase (beta-lactamase superfamily II)
MPLMTRRDLLRSGIGSAIALPFAVGGAGSSGRGHSGLELVAAPWQAGDPVAQMRAQMGAQPIVSARLSDRLTMLSGPGGNVVVLTGAEGKLVVDSFVQPAFPALKQALDKMGTAPIRMLIDTHWHMDHTDNNSNFRNAGAAILAHVNTKKRMSEAHDLLGMHFPASPASALPTQTFLDVRKMQMNGEQLEAGRIPPAHTDTDIYVHFKRSNVLHLGDVFFNGMYPFIDAGTGGHINGQIAGATLALKLADTSTKIVPGHGPVADKSALTAYRDMLVTIRDRVKTLKTSGRSLADVVAAKPSAEFDAAWGKGMMQPNDFIGIVYSTVK